VSNDYTNSNTNSKILTTLSWIYLMTLNLTLTNLHNAYQEICFCDSNEENFNDSVHQLLKFLYND